MNRKKLIVCALMFMATGAFAAPVKWQSWSGDIFEIAQKENKLVLLDLEAVWCHWCHVMDEKTYSDPKVRELLASNYISVRVDQDSRPDLSNRYEDYGWPATIIFNSKGEELAKRAGYIEPAEMRSMLKAFVDDPTPGPSVTTEPTSEASNASTLSSDLRARLEKSFFDTYDEKFGGWGTGHKFMDPDLMEHALILSWKGDRKAMGMATQTLDAARALIDPVWGGVYQYSTGGRWDEPHFEKIIYYQANDLKMYALAYLLWKRPADLKSATDIYRFLTKFLLSPEGAFYTSQDADVVRGEHSSAYFKKSDKERRKIGMPATDKHIYARENGWAIEAIVAYYCVTNDETALNQAKQAAAWIEKNRSLPNGGFRHDEQDAAGPYLADTLAMARAFVQLYSVTGDRDWLVHARDAGDFIIARFKQPSNGFLSSQFGTAGLSARPQRDENISAVRFFNLLTHYTGNNAYRAAAEHAMKYLSHPTVAEKLPPSGILLAGMEMAEDPVHVTVIGKTSNPKTTELFRTARLAFPVTYRRLEFWDPARKPLMNPDVQYPPLETPAAFVCANKRCSLPIFTVDKLKTTLEIK